MSRPVYDRWDGLVIGLAIVLACGLAMSHATSWYDGSRLATVECLVDHHTWAIDRSIGQPLAIVMISFGDSIRGAGILFPLMRSTVIVVSAGISNPVAESSPCPIAACASPR